MTSETLGELDVRPGTHHQRHTRMPEAMRCEILGVVRVPSLERVVMLSIAQTNSLPRGRIGTAGDRQAVSLLEALDRLDRSEEHTSELQSRFDLVCRLLLEKKKIS